MFGPARAEVSIIPVMQGDMVTMLGDSELPDALPILALRNTVLFPGTVIPVTVGREKSMKLIKEAEKDGKLIGTVPQKDAFIEDPVKEDLYEYGTVAKIVKTIEMPDGSITAILQGYNRFRVEAIVEYAPYLLGSAIPEGDSGRQVRSGHKGYFGQYKGCGGEDSENVSQSSERSHHGDKRHRQFRVPHQFCLGDNRCRRICGQVAAALSRGFEGKVAETARTFEQAARTP